MRHSVMLELWTFIMVAVVGVTGGCVGDLTGGTSGDGGGQIAIEVAPLSLPGVTDADYTLRVTNAADGAGEVVWERTGLTSSQYGDGSGSLSFVGPCDPATSDGINSVTLTLVALYEGNGVEIPEDTYGNPGALTRDFECLEDADVAVDFDVTIQRDATQGFFDVAVEFDEIFCSAKLDCVNDATGGDLELLHNAATGGRDLTAVMGFACTGAPSGPTFLYMDDPIIDCDDLDPIRVDASVAGNVDLTAPPSANPGDYLFAASVFRGDEELFSKSYWNIAFGLDDAAFSDAGSCTLIGSASAATELWALQPQGFQVPAGRVYPVVAWSVPLSDTGRACDSHQVNITGSGVVVDYVGYLAAPNQFTWDAEATYFDHVYVRGGDVQSAVGAYPTDGLILHVDAAVDPSGRSLDATRDVPDVMTATYVPTGPKYWTSDVTGGNPGYMLWNADARWQASGSYTLVGWFYQKTSGRQGLWSQYSGAAGTPPAKFNWMTDTNGGYYNDQKAGGDSTYGSDFYDLNTWHFHVMTYENNGRLRISVDGNPSAVVVDEINQDQANWYTSVALLARNDDLASARFDGHVSSAWYYDRVLTDEELASLYEATKARHGVDRVFDSAPGTNEPPVASIARSPSSGTHYSTTTFTWSSASSTDPDGDAIVDEEWINKRATYGRGTHTVQLRVKDARGAWSAWVSETVTVMGVTTATISVDVNPYQTYDYNLSTVPGTPVSVKLIPDPGPPNGLGRWFDVTLAGSYYSGVKIVTGGSPVTLTKTTNTASTFVRVNPSYTNSHGNFVITYRKPY